jgi:hypothetical protein
VFDITNPSGVMFWDVQVQLCYELAVEFKDAPGIQHLDLIALDDGGVGWSFWEWIVESGWSPLVSAVQESSSSKDYDYCFEWDYDG